MKVLVACEFSGRVRDAFRARGHDAWSCDLLPCESGIESGYHLEGKVEWWLDPSHFAKMKFDLMIAHPPCTFLANSGVRWLYKNGRGRRKDIERWRKMRKAAKFFRFLLDQPIEHIAIENPVMHGYGLKIIGTPHNQVIQPYQFGHGETKATCLWLKNLPPLKPTEIVQGRKPRVHHASPGPDRWKERSRTLPGIADAMADQWGRL